MLSEWPHGHSAMPPFSSIGALLFDFGGAEQINTVGSVETKDSDQSRFV